MHPVLLKAKESIDQMNQDIPADHPLRPEFEEIAKEYNDRFAQVDLNNPDPGKFLDAYVTMERMRAFTKEKLNKPQVVGDTMSPKVEGAGNPDISGQNPATAATDAANQIPNEAPPTSAIPEESPPVSGQDPDITGQAPEVSDSIVPEGMLDESDESSAAEIARRMSERKAADSPAPPQAIDDNVSPNQVGGDHPVKDAPKRRGRKPKVAAEVADAAPIGTTPATPVRADFTRADGKGPADAINGALLQPEQLLADDLEFLIDTVSPSEREAFAQAVKQVRPDLSGPVDSALNKVAEAPKAKPAPKKAGRIAEESKPEAYAEPPLPPEPIRENLSPQQRAEIYAKRLEDGFARAHPDDVPYTPPQQEFDAKLDDLESDADEFAKSLVQKPQTAAEDLLAKARSGGSGDTMSPNQTGGDALRKAAGQVAPAVDDVASSVESALAKTQSRLKELGAGGNPEEIAKLERVYQLLQSPQSNPASVKQANAYDIIDSDGRVIRAQPKTPITAEAAARQATKMLDKEGRGAKIVHIEPISEAAPQKTDDLPQSKSAVSGEAITPDEMEKWKSLRDATRKANHSLSDAIDKSLLDGKVSEQERSLYSSAYAYWKMSGKAPTLHPEIKPAAARIPIDFSDRTASATAILKFAGNYNTATTEGQIALAADAVVDIMDQVLSDFRAKDEVRGFLVDGAKSPLDVIDRGLGQMADYGVDVNKYGKALSIIEDVVSGIEQTVAKTEPANPLQRIAQGTDAGKTNWLDSLDSNKREAVFAAMRDIDNRIQAAYSSERKLQPSFGSVAVGAGQFDELIRQVGPEEFLRQLRKGATIEEATEAALKASREAVAKHNAKRPKDINWARHEGTGDDYVWRAVREIKKATEQAPANPLQKAVSPKPAEAAAKERTIQEIAESLQRTPEEQARLDEAMSVNKQVGEAQENVLLTLAQKVLSANPNPTKPINFAGKANDGVRKQLMSEILGRPATAKESSNKNLLSALADKYNLPKDGTANALANRITMEMQERARVRAQGIAKHATDAVKAAMAGDNAALAKAADEIDKIKKADEPTDGPLYQSEEADDFMSQQQKSPAFKKWFGASQVVDASGKPLVVYHGTPTGKLSDFRGTLHFTSSEKKAKEYAWSPDRDLGAVREVYLKIENPAPADVMNRVAASIRDGGGDVSDRSLMEALDKLGYDGWKVGDEYVAFRRDQVKSVDGPLYQSEEVDAFPGTRPDKFGFYLKSARVIDSKVKGAVPYDQLVKMLRNAGVKQEELDDLNFKALEGKKKITRQELADHIEQNTPVLEELKFTEAPLNSDELERYRQLESTMGPDLTDAEIQEFTRLDEKYRKWDMGQRDAEYTGYQIPGGDPGTYREFVIQNAAKTRQFREMSDKLEREIYAKRQRLNEISNTPRDKWGVAGIEEFHRLERELVDLDKELIDLHRGRKYEEFKGEDEERLAQSRIAELRSQGIEAKVDRGATYTGLQYPYGPKADMYRHSHWHGIDDPMLHIRVNDQTLPDGSKMLRVQEVQSDWHQAGKDQGYKDGPRVAKVHQQNAPVGDDLIGAVDVIELTEVSLASSGLRTGGKATSTTSRRLLVSIGLTSACRPIAYPMLHSKVLGPSRVEAYSDYGSQGGIRLHRHCAWR